MMEVPEHGYAFNDNSMEVDPLALVDTAIKTEIKEDPDQLPENTVQHELLQHGEQSEDYHGIKVEEMDESHFHIASNSDLPSIHDVGSAQLDASDNSVVSSSVVRGLQNDYQVTYGWPKDMYFSKL
ncbi:unnamed protein product [Acanthoscelides obtectus]|uniref:Uncharacterized protein n=1 Tax=Acanthoscelides obtectus TaxID=200917 RepID=A0A9P0QBQ9_ACAOB|nr:unnamed protein product [Acanthoscelides obtectus]CAK1639168.1 hypothetical protein AOBTE_LOCUS11027 [Acanthoscelides obtectus]